MFVGRLRLKLSIVGMGSFLVTFYRCVCLRQRIVSLVCLREFCERSCVCLNLCEYGRSYVCMLYCRSEIATECVFVCVCVCMGEREREIE